VPMRVLWAVLLVLLVAGLVSSKGHPKSHVSAKKNVVSHTKTSAKHDVDDDTSAQQPADENEEPSTEVAERKLEEARFYPGYAGAGIQATPFMHNPMMGHPIVEHLVGGVKAVDADTNGPRSIVVTPSYGPTSGGVWVQVVGAGSYHTPNSLQCKLDLVEQYCYSNHYFYSWCYITPKCAGVYPFRCHNGPMQFEGKYAVVAKTPWVTSVYPFSGDTAGGTAVTIRGWNFEPHCPKNLLCKFGEQVVPAKYYTSSSIMCIAPCNTEKGFVSVEVSNDGGMHWSMSGVQYGYVGDPMDLASGECQRYLSVEFSKARH